MQFGDDDPLEVLLAKVPEPNEAEVTFVPWVEHDQLFNIVHASKTKVKGLQ